MARHIAAQFNDQYLSEYPNVDGVIALTHDYGCGGCGGIGLDYIQRTISGYARHPNFHSVLILGLGCEANQIGAMMDAEKMNPSNTLRNCVCEHGYLLGYQLTRCQSPDCICGSPTPLVSVL